MTKLKMIALTWWAENSHDGAGAQLQRMVSIYAIAKNWGIHYYHTPIKNLGNYGLLAMETNSWDNSMMQRYNQLFDLSSDISIDTDWKHVYEKQMPPFHRLKEYSDKTLIHVCSSHNITDVNPKILLDVPKLEWISDKVNNPLIVGVHIRRGDILFRDPSRKLPNEFFIKNTGILREILIQNDFEFKINIYTESPTKKCQLKGSEPGAAGHKAILDPAEYKLEDFTSLDWPELQMFINTDPVQTFKDFCNCDILLISPSSFSYIAAALKRKGIVICPRFWHSPLPSFLVIEANNCLSQQLLQDRLRCFESVDSI